MCKVDIKNGDTRIDPCMRHLIKELNKLFPEHIKIIAGCCGHTKYPMTIVVRNKSFYGANTWDLVSGKNIPRKRKFYKRDKNGRYYIPEVVNGSSLD
jgi:hypothetical protein